MIYILFSILLIAFDQITKYISAKYLMDNTVEIFSWFKFMYLENRGAAFGMLSGKQTFFIILTVAVIIFLSVYVYNNRNQFNKIEKCAFVLFISGAIGNFIDRVLNGYVIDFISVRLFNVYDFPVFNLADCYISVAAFIFILTIIFGGKK